MRDARRKRLMNHRGRQMEREREGEADHHGGLGGDGEANVGRKREV